jgi:hypothetical protein
MAGLAGANEPVMAVEQDQEKALMRVRKVASLWPARIKTGQDPAPDPDMKSGEVCVAPAVLARFTATENGKQVAA